MFLEQRGDDIVDISSGVVAELLECRAYDKDVVSGFDRVPTEATPGNGVA